MKQSGFSKTGIRVDTHIGAPDLFPDSDVDTMCDSALQDYPCRKPVQLSQGSATLGMY